MRRADLIDRIKTNYPDAVIDPRDKILEHAELRVCLYGAEVVVDVRDSSVGMDALGAIWRANQSPKTKPGIGYSASRGGGEDLDVVGEYHEAFGGGSEDEDDS